MTSGEPQPQQPAQSPDSPADPEDVRRTAEQIAGDEASSIAPERGAILRDPVNKVSRRAIWYWTVSAVIGAVFTLGIASPVYFLWLPERWWWATAIYIVLVVGCFIEIFIAPSYRYAVHRWEITQIAIYTREGWLSRSQRIAPLSRVQTVDSRQSALMRAFGLSSVTVTTASAAGPITIDGLQHDTAQRVIADLTEITSATESDAT